MKTNISNIKTMYDPTRPDVFHYIYSKYTFTQICNIIEKLLVLNRDINIAFCKLNIGICFEHIMKSTPKRKHELTSPKTFYKSFFTPESKDLTGVYIDTFFFRNVFYNIKGITEWDIFNCQFFHNIILSYGNNFFVNKSAANRPVRLHNDVKSYNTNIMDPQKFPRGSITISLDGIFNEFKNHNAC